MVPFISVHTVVRRLRKSTTCRALGVTILICPNSA